MSNTIQIPATIEDATAALNGIEKLLTAKDWERAVIVYAFTREGGQGDYLKSENDKSVVFTTGEFASLGINGLKSHSTVRMYRRRWAEHDTTPLAPGDEVELPDKPFPSQKEIDPSYLMKLQNRIREDAPPEIQAGAVREILERPGVLENLEEDLTEIVSDSAGLFARAAIKADEKRPVPTPPKPKGWLHYMVLASVANEAIVRSRNDFKKVRELIEEYTPQLREDELSLGTLRETATDLYTVGAMYQDLADELAHALGDEQAKRPTSTDWIDQIEKNIARIGES